MKRLLQKFNGTYRMLAAVALCLLLSGVTALGSFDHFTRVNTYTEGKFSDIEGQWYSEAVKGAYESGIISGVSEDAFLPSGSLRISEAIVLAARIHDIYENGVLTIPSEGEYWYSASVAYAKANNIIGEAEFNDHLDAYATRAQMARIFAGALPEAALLPKSGNIVEAIPDVDRDARYGSSIYTLYSAGILAGSGEDGSFLPNDQITRAEAAAIIARLIDPSQRVSVNLINVPDKAGDDYDITWTDPVIEKITRAITGKSTGAVRRSELDFITELSVYYSSIVDYNGQRMYIPAGSTNEAVKSMADFGHFKNLESLAIQYASGLDLSDAPDMEKLVSLEIYISDNISGTNALKKYTGLKSLNLYGTECDDFSFLSSLVNLEVLDIARTGIKDLTPIANLEKLLELKIYGNECDAAVIAHMTWLEKVTVSNEVKNKEVLQQVPGYSNFNVNFNGASR